MSQWYPAAVSRDPRAWFFLITLSALAAGCSASGPPEVPEGFVCESPRAEHEGLILAGSGSNLPLARKLARAYEAAGNPPINVPGSIGTSGAVAAVADGAVDVGLASRPLRPGEPPLTVTPLARTPLAFFTASPREPPALSVPALVDLYMGRATTWPGGEPVVLLVREEGDSGNAVLAAALPELHAAMESARREGRAIVQSTDHDMGVALRDVPGALGYLDVGIVALDALPLQVVPIEINGRAIRPDAPEWPLQKTLYLLTNSEQPFVRFATRAEVRDRLSSWGYAPP